MYQLCSDERGDAQNYHYGQSRVSRVPTPRELERSPFNPRKPRGVHRRLHGEDCPQLLSPFANPWRAIGGLNQCTCAVFNSGNVNRKTAPAPAQFSAQIFPPNVSTIVRAIERPSPVPCPLVV